jgi:excisionase family DNA binding protein
VTIQLDPSARPTMTIDATADLLGISRSSAYGAAKAGDIPTIRVGRRLLVPTAALRRMLQLDEAGAA